MADDLSGEEVLQRFGKLLLNYIQPSHLLSSLAHIDGLRQRCFSRIYKMERSSGQRQDAVILLITMLQESGKGWYPSLRNALKDAGYEYVLKVLDNKETIKNQEVFEKYISFFFTDIKIRPTDLLSDLFICGAINEMDKEEITQKQQQEGAKSATMILLDVVTRKREYWFSDLMEALLSNGYRDIVEKIEPAYLKGEKSMHSIQRKIDDLYEPDATNVPPVIGSHVGHVTGQPDEQVPLMAEPKLMPSQNLPVVLANTSPKSSEDATMAKCAEFSQGSTSTDVGTKAVVQPVPELPRSRPCLAGDNAQPAPDLPRELPDGESDSMIFPLEGVPPVSGTQDRLTAVIPPYGAAEPSPVRAAAGGERVELNERLPGSSRSTQPPGGTDRSVDQDIDDLLSSIPGSSTAASSDEDEADDTFYPAVEEHVYEEETQELKLRNYQVELARLAIQGKNVIVNAPTGSGKTLVAVKVTKEHLQHHEGYTKVMLLVPTVSLVEQQLKLFRTYLEPPYTCYGISGDSQAADRVPLTFLLESYNVFVCTAQILVDALRDGSMQSLSCFSLLVFDECHHTMKGHPYNKIMYQYLDEKFSNRHVRLPQIVGLTASVGTGKASSLEKTKEHILTMCANLDAFYIATVKQHVDELQRYSHKPRESTVVVRARSNDPFHTAVSRLMNNIDFKMKTAEDDTADMKEITSFRMMLNKPPPASKREQYTQWLSNVEKEAKLLTSSIQLKRIYIACIDHLKVYNRALNLNADCRTLDGYEYIDKNLPNLHGPPHGDETDLWLDKLYKSKEAELRRLSVDASLKNPKLEALKKIILENYRDRPDSRVIVFAKTRELTIALCKWMEDSRDLSQCNPERLVGANASANEGGMTGNQQTDVLQYFKEGGHGLLIATSVAEEGLDVSKCNLVIRYLHVTNEISRVQTMGRGRADDAVYVVIAEMGSGAAEKEKLNEARQRMMKAAIAMIEKMSDAETTRSVEKIQRDLQTKRRLTQANEDQRKQDGDQMIYTLYCVKCNNFVCYSFDLRKIEDAHHVVIDEEFYNRADIQLHDDPVAYGRMGDFVKLGKLYCSMCRREKGDWGIMAKYLGASYPVLKITSFIVKDSNGDVFVCKKWKDVPFTVCPLSTEDIERKIEMGKK